MIDPEDFRRMTLDDKTEYTDMVVKVGNALIPCNKTTVCRYSKVIRAAMASDMIEGTSGVFTITHELATEDNVRQLLLAMYDPWDVDTMDGHVLDICRLAHVYDSARVLDMAGGALKRLMTRDNFWQTVAIADECGLDDVIEACCAFATDKTQLHLVLDDDGIKAATASNPGGVARVQAAIIRVIRNGPAGDDVYRLEDIRCGRCFFGCSFIDGLRAGQRTKLTHQCGDGHHSLGTITKM